MCTRSTVQIVLPRPTYQPLRSFQPHSGMNFKLKIKNNRINILPTAKPLHFVVLNEPLRYDLSNGML